MVVPLGQPIESLLGGRLAHRHIGLAGMVSHGRRQGNGGVPGVPVG